MSAPSSLSDPRLIDCPTQAPDWAAATAGVQKIIVGELGEDNSLQLGALPADLANRFPQLTHLHLWNCAGVKELPRLPDGMQVLDVRGGAGLRRLANLPASLRVLVLDECAGLTRLPVPLRPGAASFALEELSLKGDTALESGDVLALLRLSPGLRLFDASGLARLNRIPGWPGRLERIELNGCTGIDLLEAVWPAALRRLGLRGATGVRTLARLPEALDYLDLANTAALQAMPDFAGRPRTLFLHGSGVPLAPELFGENANANVAGDVMPWLEAARAGEVADNEVKVILLGNGRCGKTSLARRLVDENFDARERSTHGVQLWRTRMSFWPEGGGEAETAILNVWDFAGQDLYHSTHRLFLQSKAVFVLCGSGHGWGADEAGDRREARSLTEEDQVKHAMSYWWSQLTSLPPAPGMTAGPPVILVRTKLDRDGEAGAPPAARYWQELDIDVTETTDQIDVSARNGHGLDKLKDALAGAAARVLGNHTRRAIPRSVANLKAKLTELKTTNETEWRKARIEKRPAHPPQPTLRYRADDVGAGAPGGTDDPGSFFALAHRYCPGYPVDRLIHWLHQTGFLYHPAEHLSEVVILDQRWALDAIYVLTRRGERLHELMRLTGGRVTAREMAEHGWEEAARAPGSAWPRFSAEEQQLFLRFMLSCGMCFKLLDAEHAASGETVYAVPGYFRLRQYQVLAMPDLDSAPPGVWQQLTFDACGEGDVQALVAWLGRHWGRSASLWRWGGQVKSARSDAWCRIDWIADRERGYVGNVKVWFFGAEDAGFMFEAVEGLLREIKREHGEAALGKLGLEPRRWRDEEGGPEMAMGRSSKAGGPRHRGAKSVFSPDDPTAAEHGLIASGIPTADQAVDAGQVRVCFSYASGDATHPRLGDVPVAVAKQLRERGDAKVFCYQVKTEEERNIADLAEFMAALAKGDLVLLFWSARYFRSWVCMTEMMHIYRAMPAAGAIDRQLRVWGFDGARVDETSGSVCHHSAIECFWRQLLNEREERFRESYGGDVQRMRSASRAETMHEWFEFVGDESGFNAFLRRLVGFRFMQPLDVAATDGQIAEQTRTVIEDVEAWMAERGRGQPLA